MRPKYMHEFRKWMRPRVREYNHLCRHATATARPRVHAAMGPGCEWWFAPGRRYNRLQEIRAQAQPPYSGAGITLWVRGATPTMNDNPVTIYIYHADRDLVMPFIAELFRTALQVCPHNHAYYAHRATQTAPNGSSRDILLTTVPEPCRPLTMRGGNVHFDWKNDPWVPTCPREMLEVLKP